MKQVFYKSASAAVLLLFFCVDGFPIPYTLWKIQKVIHRGDYSRASERLREVLPDLKGEEREWGELLAARLETDRTRAASLYSGIIASGGNVAYTARLEMAKIHYAEANYREAETLLEVIPDSEESKVRQEALFFRGLSHKLLGETSLARSDFGMIDRGKYLYPSYMELAELDMQTGKYADAIEKYEAIGGIHSNPAAIFKLGVCYEIVGERGNALRAYQSLRNNYPHSLEAPKAATRIKNLSETPDSRGSSIGPPEDKRGSSKAVYTIQFGAFGNRENAESLYSEISKILPEARIENAVTDPGSEIFRVRSGRYARRSMAERDSIMVVRKHGYNSRILTVR